MALQLREDLPSIVILGGFDPRGLHPLWFRSENLLGHEEAAQAELKVMFPDLTEWSTESLLLHATRDRLLVQARLESAADAVRDLVLGILQLLEHTRVTALGLNRSMHFDVGGEANWHKVGDTLAPKAIWDRHLGTRVGMRVLQLERSPRGDGLAGKTVVGVYPSVKLAHGVYFDVNNELTIDGGDAGNARGCAEMISTHWSRLLDEARTMAESVLEEATQ